MSQNARGSEIVKSGKLQEKKTVAKWEDIRTTQKVKKAIPKQRKSEKHLQVIEVNTIRIITGKQKKSKNMLESPKNRV